MQSFVKSRVLACVVNLIFLALKCVNYETFFHYEIHLSSKVVFVKITLNIQKKPISKSLCARTIRCLQCFVICAYQLMKIGRFLALT